MAEGADLAAGDEHHVRACLAHRLGALRAPAKSASACAESRSTGNGENHASSPASAACLAATLSRSGSRPEMRTASQCRSSAMTAISRLTAWESKVFLVRLFPGKVPVS